jgi:dipeptidyl aminopeptidase/acylaminoacyl peptidase
VKDFVAEFPRPDLAEFFRTYAIMGFDVDRDETRMIFSTNLGGQAYNIWGLDLYGSSYPYPLTYVDQTPSAMKQDPAGRYILAGFDTDGNELAQLYLVPPRGGALKPLVTAEGARFMLPFMSEDGNRIYYTSDRDNRRFLSVYRLNLATGEERVLFHGEAAPTFLEAVSPDEQSLVVGRQFANTYQPAFLVRDGVWTPLVPDPTRVHMVNDSVFLDDHTVVFTTNYEAPFAYLALYDDQGFRELARVPHDLGSVAVHRDSRTIYVIAHAGVQDRLYRYDWDRAALVEDTLPVAVAEQMQVGRTGTLYLLGRSDIDPFNVWRRRPGADWERLTNNQVMGMARDQLVEADVVRFPSFDGLEIEALWFAARPEVANGYTIVWPHGGPQAAERKMFRPFFQFAVARGYNIWAPNFRGSSGYGADFMRMVERDWGEGPRKDMMASVDWLIASGRAHADKLFVVGGSYGGYMTLLLHALHADRFQAFVDIFGPSNLLTFAESVPEFWKPIMRQWLGDPVEDRERLVKDSPITYLDRMTRPMLVIQGANDPRVVKAESDQIVAALRDQGVTVEYLVFDDEGHGFMKKDNEIAAYRRVIEFLDAQRI